MCHEHQFSPEKGWHTAVVEHTLDHVCERPLAVLKKKDLPLRMGACVLQQHSCLAKVALGLLANELLPCAATAGEYRWEEEISGSSNGTVKLFANGPESSMLNMDAGPYRVSCFAGRIFVPTPVTKARDLVALHRFAVGATWWW